jgi:hypothetical protein
MGSFGIEYRFYRIFNTEDNIGNDVMRRWMVKYKIILIFQ